MRFFQDVLERLARCIAYTLPLSQLWRCCLCGCTMQEEMQRGSAWSLPALGGAEVQPCLLQMGWAPDLV